MFIYYFYYSKIQKNELNDTSASQASTVPATDATDAAAAAAIALAVAAAAAIAVVVAAADATATTIAAIAASGGKVWFGLVFLPITANGELDCWSSSGESGEPRTELRVRFSGQFHSHSLVFKLRTKHKIIIKTCKNFFVEYIKLLLFAQKFGIM